MAKQALAYSVCFGRSVMLSCCKSFQSGLRFDTSNVDTGRSNRMMHIPLSEHAGFAALTCLLPFECAYCRVSPRMLRVLNSGCPQISHRGLRMPKRVARSDWQVRRTSTHPNHIFFSGVEHGLTCNVPLAAGHMGRARMSMMRPARRSSQHGVSEFRVGIALGYYLVSDRLLAIDPPFRARRSSQHGVSEFRVGIALGYYLVSDWLLAIAPRFRFL